MSDDAWLGFLGGILAALVAALVASITQRCHEASKRKQQAQLDVYFNLIDLKNWYFWVTTAEFHDEDPDPQVLTKCHSIALSLNDSLRTFDQVMDVEEILSILFSESIPTASERAEKLNALIDRYGKSVSPKHAEVMGRIGRENLLRHGPGPTPSMNAPGSWRYHK
jgi:hypothetical protein